MTQLVTVRSKCKKDLVCNLSTGTTLRLSPRASVAILAEEVDSVELQGLVRGGYVVIDKPQAETPEVDTTVAPAQASRPRNRS